MFQISLSTIVAFYQSPVVFGILWEVLFILFLAFNIRKFPNNKLSILFEVVYSKMHAFYLDILGKKEDKWILNYILTLFCVIFFSNVLWVVLELISPFFWINSEGEFLLDTYIAIPSSDINFNLAMAIMSMAVLIYIQIKGEGIGKFLYQFIPFKGKWYIPIERWNLRPVFYYPLYIFTKFFDIIISIFLGLLDVVEYFARIISLSFRLFGNIMSWGILLGMVFVWIWALTTSIWKGVGNFLEIVFSWLWFPWIWVSIGNLLGHNFPVVIPIFMYIEDIMVSFIQAMVFALLISIFIKVARIEAEEGM